IVSKRKGADTYSFSDTIVNMCCGMLERLFDLFYVVMMYFVFGFLFDKVALWHIPDHWTTWVAALLVGDLLAYWHHRLSHEINFLWAAHIVHHSSEEMNITNVFRVSAFAVINRSFFWIWMPLMGFSPEMTTSAIVFIGLFQFVTHTRLVKKLGVLERFMVTPSHHRVHHGRNEKYLDKNYGHVFIIWDKMFGTFAPEEEEPDYGITTGLASANPYWTYLHYWSDLFRRAKQANRWQDKLRVFIAPPTWTPEGVEFSGPAYQLDEEGQRMKYKLKMPFRLGLYVFVNIMIVLGAFLYLSTFKNTFENPTVLDLLTSPIMIQLAVIIAVSAFSFGLLMERKRSAMLVELGRLFFLAINAGVIFWNAAYGSWIIGACVLGLSFFALWMVRMRDYFGYLPPEDMFEKIEQEPSSAEKEAVPTL
ncbi:MAG: sterol desaturase family protein, partial [Bacteroidota bacterium]